MEPFTPIVDRDKIRSYLEREARLWGALVKARRKSLRLSLAAVAELAGTTPQTVHKVEQGEIVARDHLRVALAFALATEVHDLFPMPKRQAMAAEVAA